MTLSPSESNKLRNLEKKLRKNKLNESERKELQELNAKKKGTKPIAEVTAADNEERRTILSSENKTYTIVVDSSEKKDAIEAALDDIESFRKSELMKIEEEIKAMKAKAERDIHLMASEQTAAACEEILKDAEKKSEKIIASAKEQSEKASKEYIDKAKNEAEAAEEDHKKYARLIAEITAKKIDYRHEALDEVSEEIKKYTDDRNNLLTQLSKLKSDNNELSLKAAELEGDLSFYENSFGKISEARENLTKMEYENKFMTEQYENLKKHFDEKGKEIVELRDRLLAIGENPEEARSKLAYLNAQIEELRIKLEKYPSNWEEVVQRSNELDNCRKKLEELNVKNQELNNQIFSLQIEQNELEDYRKFVKILELQREELKAELERNIAQYENRNGKVFAGLSKIDDETFLRHKHRTVNLKTLCEGFRAYLNSRGSDKTSNKVSLYYDERTIRTFIAGFASSRTMIFEGLSGTGKTSLPIAFADYMGSTTDVIAVQSSWKDKNDLLGFYNDFKKQYIETDFLKCLYRASCDRENIHIIVLDEMNLSRIEYYFADILSKLELNEGKRTISLIPNAVSISDACDSWPKRIHDGELEIPDNVWFIGTANKDDSTFTITDKVYDRSVVINFDSKGIPDKSLKYARPEATSFEDFKKALNETRWSESSDDYKKFQKIMDKLDELLKPFDITFGNRIYRQLEKFIPAYIACGGTMREAIDIMFSLKVIRKLEGLYDDRTKSNLEKLETELDEMPLSQARVKLLSSRIS